MSTTISFTEFGPTGRNTAWRVVEGIANSRRMVVVCGAGIFVAAGIPAFRFGQTWNEDCLLGEDGSPTKTKPSSLFTKSGEAKGKVLEELNNAMTRWRIHARTAPLTTFHHFLHRAMDDGRVVKCLTRNFDGLETRDRPDLEDNILMVHGDNRILTCEAHDCSVIEEDAVLAFDQLFLDQQTVPCPGCAHTCALKQELGKRIIGKIHDLRPAVHLDEHIDPELQVGSLHHQLLEEVKGCDLLLIAGTSLKTQPILSLVQDIANKVHSQDGAVVVIDSAEFRGGTWSTWVHFHLKMDIQDCAEAILKAMDKGSKETASNIWQEFWERDVAGEFFPELPLPTDQVCCQCTLGILDVLFPCAQCGDIYCFASNDERMGRMCVTLDYFAEVESPLPFYERVQSFICYKCFPHGGIIPYPHFIRQIPKVYEEPDIAPRLVLIVFYLSQFWPIAESLIGCVTSTWKTLGWTSYTVPIKLQVLQSYNELSFNCPWEPQSYNLLVVFLTHGLSGSRNYQLADDIEANPTTFLETTLKPAFKLVDQAKMACGYLLTCGHVYDSSENVLSIQRWVDRPRGLTSLVGTVNKRLAATYMTNFIAQSAVAMLGYRSWNSESVLDVWIRDTLACSHSDLIYFGRNEAPRIFYFSPFQTRPLGKDLPSLLSSCFCSGTGMEGKKKKIWKVTHNGKHNMSLGEVWIVASCGLCGNKWKMHEPHLPGRLHNVAGLYAAEVPFFCD